MMLFGGFFWLLFLAGLVLLVAWLLPGHPWFRAGSGGLAGGRGGGEGESVLEILNRRYARGEINREEFERMKRDLSS